jgi:hypothetical protein
MNLLPIYTQLARKRRKVLLSLRKVLVHCQAALTLLKYIDKLHSACGMYIAKLALSLHEYIFKLHSACGKYIAKLHSNCMNTLPSYTQPSESTCNAKLHSASKNTLPSFTQPSKSAYNAKLHSAFMNTLPSYTQSVESTLPRMH